MDREGEWGDELVALDDDADGEFGVDGEIGDDDDIRRLLAELPPHHIAHSRRHQPAPRHGDQFRGR